MTVRNARESEYAAIDALAVEAWAVLRDGYCEDGAPCIGLHTSPIMTVALPMYLRMGFVRAADLPAMAGAPYGRYVLDFAAQRKL